MNELTKLNYILIKIKMVSINICKISATPMVAKQPHVNNLQLIQHYS